MRHRHALYLSETLSQQLAITAETHHVSKSAILERALTQYLAAATSTASNSLQTLQQEQTTRSLRRLERDLAVTSELTATFMRYFLTITPSLPPSEHAAARAIGQLRYQQMIEEIAKQLRTDRSLLARVMATMTDESNETNANNQRRNDDHASPPSEPVSNRPQPDDHDG
jgi:predicted transcriptional regulator